MSEKKKPKTAIVIGAGVGGVATAARLAKAGFTVTVLEKNSFTGGRCSLIHSPTGHRFDQGPSLLLLPHLFHSTFADLGTSLEKEEVHLKKCEPNYNVWFDDGERVVLSSDLAVMKGEIERWEGKDGYSRYLDFLKESHAHYEISVEHVLLKNFTSFWSMLRWDFLKELLRLHPFESIYTRAAKYFWTERLRRAFTFASMYMGMSPFDAPGTYSLLQYTEFAEGIWYPVGGFHRVVAALVEIGERSGVTYRMNTGVDRILLSPDSTRAIGVTLSSGEQLLADVVINNTDLVYAYSNLLPPSPYSTSLSNRPGSCSSISFYWGLSRKVPELSAHNIFLANEYRKSFDSIFKDHLIPSEPSFYVNVPSRIDPSASPSSEKDTVVVLVPVGHLLDSSPSPSSSGDISAATPTRQQDWNKMLDLARTTVLSTVSARTGVDLGPLIEHEEHNHPESWRARFNLDKGAILGLSHSFFNVLCFRPTTRARRPAAYDGALLKLGDTGGRIAETLLDAFRGREGRDLKGLYFVGASAHPGTGVPIVLAGAKLVAEQVCGDFGMGVPWLEKGRGEGRKGLDRVERPVWLDDWETWFRVAVAVGLVAWVWVGWVVVLGR